MEPKSNFILDDTPSLDNSRLTCQETGLEFKIAQKNGDYRLSFIDGDNEEIFVLTREELKSLWMLLSSNGSLKEKPSCNKILK